ncbi:hypothetical protein, partial [Klebsiella pneumoniae]
RDLILQLSKSSIYSTKLSAKVRFIQQSSQQKFDLFNKALYRRKTLVYLRFHKKQVMLPIY